MAQEYPIVGIQDSGTQPRLEIRDLQKKPIQFSLFIQAYNNILNMRSKDQSSSDYLDKPNSWWQIGGIHGLPFQPWTGDPKGPQTADPNSGYGGYCYHSSALFPTWHRVLMLLTEQAIVREAIAIATKLEESNPTAKSEKWVQAAKELRHPFWDWTLTETAKEGIPQIFQEPQVQIVQPGDVKGTLVDNPLNHYKYAAEPGTVQGFEYMATWTRTWRWVNRNVDPTEEQYNLALKAYSVGTTLNLGGEDIQLQPVHWLRGKVAALFNYPLTLDDASYGPNLWGFFSNTGSASTVFSPVSTALSSVEEPHNMVHLNTGGNGSMSMNEYAAFDPIFYMHHANVDRLYAFWEYVYPNYWIESGWKNEQGETVPFENSDSGNFQQDPDASIDHATSLIPFRNATSIYWTSDDTRSLLSTSTVNKYYTYPAITDPRSSVTVKVDVPYDTSDKALREEYRQALLYEWDPEIHKALKTVKKLSANLQPQHRDLLLQEHEASGTSRLRHFVVQAKVPEFAFNGSHRLELLVHPPKDKQSTAHVVNSTSVLSRADTDKCAACKNRQAAGNKIRGYMPVDPRIVLYLISQLDQAQLAVLTDLDKLSVLIKESLGTRLVKPDGTVLAVADTNARHPNNEALEVAKAPELTLHSHTIAFNHKAYSGDVAPAVKLENHTDHGHLGDKESWKIL